MQTTLSRPLPVLPQPEKAGVFVSGYFYSVDLGQLVRPRHHYVGINAECTCDLGRHCPAVEAVRLYLSEGGERAQRPPFGYYPVRPAKCPLCGGPTSSAPSLSSRQRGEGWVCPSGKSHYWQHRARISALRKKLAESGRLP